MKFFSSVFVVSLVCGGADAGLVYGPDAEDQFAQMHADLGEGEHLDFESVSAGTDLLPGADPFDSGARFASIINWNGAAFGPEHVEVSNSYHADTFGHTIVGSPFPNGTDDGRVGYEVRFDTPQRRAAIRRLVGTNGLTRFYNADGDLLVEHRNTTAWEFVGWLGESDDGSDWVARIVMDGLAPSGTRQVGYSDDLYFGTLIPAPAGTVLLIGLTALRRRR